MVAWEVLFLLFLIMCEESFKHFLTGANFRTLFTVLSFVYCIDVSEYRSQR
jgi:hypothetical protein